MKRRPYLELTPMAAIPLAGCIGKGTADDESGGCDGDGGSDHKLELLDHKLVRENAGTMADSLAVGGSPKNVSGETLSYAEVKAKFYDERSAIGGG